MSATAEADLAVTPESAPNDAVLLCDPLKIRGREWLMRTCQDDDDDFSDVGEDSGLGGDSHVGAETVSRIIDFFRQSRPAGKIVRMGGIFPDFDCNPTFMQMMMRLSCPRLQSREWSRTHLRPAATR